MPVTVIPAASVRFPKSEFVVLKLAVPVKPVKSILAPSLGMSVAMVPEAPASIMTLSWGSGTRLVQLPALDQLPPAPVLVWVAGASKVILALLPSEFPIEVPVQGMAAPVADMSLKSTFVKDTAPALTVAGEPIAKDCTCTRLTALLPVTVRVPVMTVLPPLNCRASILLAAPIRVRLAQVKLLATAAVLAPVRVIEPPFVLNPEPPNQAELAPDKTTFEVLAVIVRLVKVPVFQALPVAVRLMVDAPSVRVRALVFDDTRLPQVQVWPFVFKVPDVRVTAPATVELALCKRVRSDLLIVIEFAFAVTPVIVTVAELPEFASKKTSSDAVGTDAPLAPPEVAAQ